MRWDYPLLILCFIVMAFGVYALQVEEITLVWNFPGNRMRSSAVLSGFWKNVVGVVSITSVLMFLLITKKN